MQCSGLKVSLEDNGKVTFYYNGEKIIEEKPELTFESGYRNYQNTASGNWKARVTFLQMKMSIFTGSVIAGTIRLI